MVDYTKWDHIDYSSSMEDESNNALVDIMTTSRSSSRLRDNNNDEDGDVVDVGGGDGGPMNDIEIDNICTEMIHHITSSYTTNEAAYQQLCLVQDEIHRLSKLEQTKTSRGGWRV